MTHHDMGQIFSALEKQIRYLQSTLYCSKYISLANSTQGVV